MGKELKHMENQQSERPTSSEDAQGLTFDTPWTWWEHTQGGDYSSSANNLGTCDNIAMFWQYFNNIPRPLSFFTSKNARRKLVGNRKVDALSIFREESSQNGRIQSMLMVANFFSVDPISRWWTKCGTSWFFRWWVRSCHKVNSWLVHGLSISQAKAKTSIGLNSGSQMV